MAVSRLLAFELSRVPALVLYQSAIRTFCHKQFLVKVTNKSFCNCNCEESKYHHCFVALPYIKSQRKQNEVALHPAPYDSIQMSRTLNTRQPNDQPHKSI